MKFIVKLVFIQHPVLIPIGYLFHAHHPLSPPSPPPSTLSLFSVFKSLLWAGGGGMMGIEEGTFWDEHWVLYGNQFDNKFHILKKNVFNL